MIDLETIKALLAETDEHTLSIYLNVNPGDQQNQSRTPAWRIQLKNELNAIEASLGDEHRDIWRHLRQQVEQFLTGYHIVSKGLALFFGPHLQQVYELPLPIETQCAYGRPLVAPLLWAIEEYQRYLILLVDQEKAHFIVAYLGSAGLTDTLTLELDTEDWREKSLMPATSYGRELRSGSYVDHFEDRVEAHLERFYREVIARAQELKDERGFDRIVLGGSEQSAHALINLMPDKLAAQVIATLSIPMRAAPHQALEQALPAALAYERQRERELVEQVIGLAKAGGRAVLGREAVEKAIEQQLAELLIIPWTLADEELKARLPAQMLMSGGQIELVHGEAAERLQAEGEVAARLYYGVPVIV